MKPEKKNTEAAMPVGQAVLLSAAEIAAVGGGLNPQPLPPFVADGMRLACVAVLEVSGAERM